MTIKFPCFLKKKKQKVEFDFLDRLADFLEKDSCIKSWGMYSNPTEDCYEIHISVLFK